MAPPNTKKKRDLWASRQGHKVYEPTLEEIWGEGGLAEKERENWTPAMERQRLGKVAEDSMEVPVIDDKCETGVSVKLKTFKASLW